MKTRITPIVLIFVLAVLFGAAPYLPARGQREGQAGAPAAGQREGVDQPAAAGGLSAADAALPLTDVVLFSSGVGYFKRSGVVDGDASLDLHFKSKDINDLLKSLVVQDLDGGRVTGVTYSSRDPVSRTLKSFAVDLTEDPPLADILRQVRGEAVEVLTSRRISGTVVGVETRPSGEFTFETFVDLLTATGLSRINLAKVREVRFLNPALQEELAAALNLLAENRSAESKRVSLRFKGRGKRRIQVGYLTEAPLWKTSYRLVLGPQEEHFLQGWALVENTTDEDWRQVNLSLVSGRPVSFTMDLYRPLYVPRPEVQPELYSSLAPQRYEGNLAGAAQRPKAPAAKSRIASEQAAPSSAGARAEEADRYSEEQLLDLTRGVSAAAQGLEAGNLFRYAISDRVTVPRQESAMLPIVNQYVEGRRVSIYNPGVQAKHPMYGLKLRNTTGFDLRGGPLTVFEEGSYAGDAMIDTLPAGAERLISFALDLDVEVAARPRSVPETLVSVRIVKGSMISTVSLRREVTYIVKNSGGRPRSVLIEHPLSPDWELVQPAAAAETTGDRYRFSVEVSPGGSEVLTVAQERRISRSVQLTNISTDQITYYLSSENLGYRVKQALEGLTERKNGLARTLAARREQERRVDTIHREQGRIRSNMQRLDHDSALYERYVSLLGEQEDRLEAALGRIETLRAEEQRRREDLDRYVLSLDVP